jgi:hypothetical protein
VNTCCHNKQVDNYRESGVPIVILDYHKRICPENPNIRIVQGLILRSIKSGEKRASFTFKYLACKLGFHSSFKQ